MIINANAQSIINSPVRGIRGRVEVYEASTLIHTFYPEDKLIEFSVERECEEGKFFGFGICQSINIKLIDTNREINLSTSNTIKISYNVSGEWIYPYPTFYITQTRRDEKTNQITIYGYDILFDAAKHYTEEVSLAAPYTLLEYAIAASMVFGASGITSKNVLDASFDTAYPEGANIEGTETLREILDDVAEATQTIYYITPEDKVMFKRLTTAAADVEITKAKYFSLESKDSRRLQTIVSATELGDNYSASTSSLGSTQYVRDNAFWVLRDDIATLVDNAVAAIGNLTINQFDCDWRGDFLVELGDCLAIETKNGDFVYSFLLDDKVVYDGTFSQSTSWEYDDENTEDESNSTNLGEALKQTYAKVDKANKQVEIMASEVSQYNERITNAETKAEEANSKVGEFDTRIDAAEEAANNAQEAAGNNIGDIETLKTQMATLQLDTQSINATVAEIQESTTTDIDGIKTDVNNLTKKVNASITAEDVQIQIQRELEDGVSSVSTTTGYTFNESGLSISKSGSEMTTTITEDGMTVSKNSETMLTANNQGVDAVNLHATTYLIVGEYSRFEDYGSGRTGCFWIGG